MASAGELALCPLQAREAQRKGQRSHFAFRTHLPPTAGRQQLLSAVPQAETPTGCNCGSGDSSRCIVNAAVCLLLLNLFMTVEAAGGGCGGCSQPH